MKTAIELTRPSGDKLSVGAMLQGFAQQKWPRLTITLLVIFGKTGVDGKPIVSVQAFVSSLPWSPSVTESPGPKIADGYYLLDDVLVPLQRSAVRNQTHRWSGGKIPYVIDKDYPPASAEKVVAAMREIEHSVGNSTDPCLKFVSRTAEASYVWIHNGTGCHSVIGFDDVGPQETSLSLQCAVKGVVLHELLHVLGLYHEQDRYDRDNWVDINVTNIMESGYRNFDLRNESEIDTLDTPYDFGSIMHYGAYNFALDTRRPVITPKPQYAKGTIMGQRLGLSQIDVLRIQRMYRCPEDLSHIVSDGEADNSILWCDFDNQTCDLTVEANDPLNIASWEVTRGPTVDGPTAGFTNGLDPFLHISKKPKMNPASPSSITYSPANVTSDTPTATMTTVSLKTPLLVADVSELCLDVVVFMPGPSTYFQIYCSGPAFRRVLFLSAKGIEVARWGPARLSMTIPAGVQFQIEIMAILEDGFLSLDNLRIYKTHCH